MPQAPLTGAMLIQRKVEDIHQIILPLGWVILSDLMIFFAFYSYRKYAYYVHAVLGLLLILTTYGLALPILFIKGLGARPKVILHSQMGIVLLVFMTVQGIVGLTSRLIQQRSSSKSLTLYWLKCVHRYLGSSLLFGAKLQCLYMYQGKITFWLIIGWESLLIAALITRKLAFLTIEETILPRLSKNNCQEVASVNSTLQLHKATQENPHFVIFANDVYDVSPLLVSHPAGYQIIQFVIGREIDRFIYGMYTSEKLPALPSHTHSFKSFQLIKAPIAKIEIPSLYSGFDENFVSMRIMSRDVISRSAEIYELNLVPQKCSLLYQGYSSVHELGRCYSLTINNRTTRLYTSVNFLRKPNKKMLKNIFPGIQIKSASASKKEERLNVIDEDLLPETERITLKKVGQTLPLLLKRYAKGSLTPKLLEDGFKGVITLGAQRGMGLQFDSIPAGKILIVAGGTGLYPFSDLIDLLFKQKLIEKGFNQSAALIQADPILGKNVFKQFEFELLAAFNSFEDIHPITLLQITFLCEQRCSFEATFKFKDSPTFLSPAINTTHQRFDTLIDFKIAQGVSRLLICGPPPMNESLANQLRQNGLDESKYKFI